MHSLRGNPRRSQSEAVAFFLALALASSLGCTAQTNQVASGDPLFGDTPSQPGLAPPKPAAPVPQRAQTPAPPIPTTGLSNTNAALASANPLPGSRPLAIPDNRPPAPPANNPPQFAANPKSAQTPPKVMPLPREGTTPNLGTLASAPAPAPQVNTVVNDLQTALRARGVLFQKHDPIPQGIRFQCIVPSKQNPDTTRVFEATARDYATAVQAVLKQIDEQR